jgi:diamine N-acetyltransferase
VPGTIDAAGRRRGIGRRAVELLAEELRAGGAAVLETSYVPVEGGAAGFWRRCGFTPTDRESDGEPVVARRL